MIYFVSCYCLNIKDEEEIGELEWGKGGREKRGTDTYIIRANTLDLICYSEDNDLKLRGSEGGREGELQKKGRVNTSNTDLQRRGEERRVGVAIQGVKKTEFYIFFSLCYALTATSPSHWYLFSASHPSDDAFPAVLHIKDTI